MKKMIVVLVFLAAIAAVLFFGLRAGEEGVAVASATVTPTLMPTVTPEPVALATPVPVPVPEVNSVADLVQVATGETPDYNSVPATELEDGYSEVAVASVTVTPMPVATLGPDVPVAWYVEFIEADASKLFATVFGWTTDSRGRESTFVWAIQESELHALEEGVDYAELSQFVQNWNEFQLPQNSLGVICTRKGQNPEGLKSKSAAHAAPADTVRKDGVIDLWRKGISSDPAALKVAKFDTAPAVIVLRNPDPVTGQRYFLVVDGKENAPRTAGGGSAAPAVPSAPSGGGSNVESTPDPAPAPEYNSKPDPAPAPEYNSKPVPGGPAPEYNSKPAAGGSESSSNNGGYSEKPAAGGASAGGHQTTTDDLSGAGPRR